MPSALAVFACRPNSHPFQERHVYLDEPVKIGRSVARCRPAQNNATFDCKVLSRNHALVWFDHKTGKFYLQDTKSSNGTFINSQRLSRGSEESPPCEVLSGDIIQFGVDVTENTRKVTHGCIVSTIKLFLPDGMEARRRSDVIQAPLPLPVDKVAANTPSMYSQELFQLSQYLQEALHREQMLEQKLATLQRLLSTTQEASESSWQALIDEDRLLSRLEVMGSQLQAYSKSQTEDGIRKELLALQEDKHNYETTAKESLRRVLQEKIEVVRKLSEVERSLSNTEDECTHLKEMSERGQEELRELANKYNVAVNEIKELTDKIKAAEGRQEELTQRGASEKRELELRIEEMEEKEQVLQARIEALQADNDFTNERLAALQGSILKIVPERNQMDAKESDMSDTLSPSKDRSSDDTSGQPNYLNPSLLEEERRNNSKQTEESTKQIQYLQSSYSRTVQLVKVEIALWEIIIHAPCASFWWSQILVLRHAAEAATAERERDIAALQEDLGSVRCELERWRSTAAKSEEEISRLQEDLAQQQLQRSSASQLQVECATLQQRCASLQQDCDSLREERTTLTDKLHRLEAELCSTRAQSLVLSNSLESLEKREELLQGKLGSLENRQLQDESRLKNQLDQAHDRTDSLQKEYEDMQSQLSDLRQRYERTEREKTNIHQELEQCRSNLKLLQDKNSSVSAHTLIGVTAVTTRVKAAPHSGRWQPFCAPKKIS
uniref:Sarcolemmal membrane-associated protein n=1 Tax=Hippocampus comes TaxID=109280 RepID=A0A3Q2YF59_HIPCM